MILGLMHHQRKRDNYKEPPRLVTFLIVFPVVATIKLPRTFNGKIIPYKLL